MIIRTILTPCIPSHLLAGSARAAPAKSVLVPGEVAK